MKSNLEAKLEQKIKEPIVYIKENKISVSIGAIILFCFFIPILINLFYLIGIDHPLIITSFNASDIINYYGTLIGAAAIITTVTWTIRFSKESAEADRKISENNSYRNYGIDICIKYLEFCGESKTIALIGKIYEPGMIENIERYNLEIRTIMKEIFDGVTETHGKFMLFHPNISSKEFKEIMIFYTHYDNYLDKLEDLLLVTDGCFEYERFDKIEALMHEYNEKYFVFLKIMQRIIFNYDYTIIKSTHDEKETNPSQNNHHN